MQGNSLLKIWHFSSRLLFKGLEKQAEKRIHFPSVIQIIVLMKLSIVDSRNDKYKHLKVKYFVNLFVE